MVDAPGLANLQDVSELEVAFFLCASAKSYHNIDIRSQKLRKR